MAYFSKEAEILAFRQLSELSADPLKQGATQKVSAIRHALALDEYYKHHGVSCDTTDREDTREFEEYVGRVVSLFDGYYTPNFYSIKNGNNNSKAVLKLYFLYTNISCVPENICVASDSGSLHVIAKGSCEDKHL